MLTSAAKQDISDRLKNRAHEKALAREIEQSFEEEDEETGNLDGMIDRVAKIGGPQAKDKEKVIVHLNDYEAAKQR